jgi:hypothetical protein
LDGRRSRPSSQNITVLLLKTLRNKKMEYHLRANLKIDELEQIDDFCQKHLISN